MTASEDREPVLACTLSKTDFKSRVAKLASLNRHALRTQRRDGLRLILTYETRAISDVREMVRLEQECCSFLDFAIQEGPDAVTLVIAAPNSALDMLDAVFAPFLGLAKPNGCCDTPPSVRRP